MAAKLLQKLETSPVLAIHLCNHAIELSNLRSSALSKSERITVLYYASSIRLNVALDLLIHHSDSGMVLSDDGKSVSWCSCAGILKDERDERLWRVVLQQVKGLEECRKREHFHHKSLYMLAWFIFRLKQHNLHPPISLIGEVTAVQLPIADIAIPNQMELRPEGIDVPNPIDVECAGSARNSIIDLSQITYQQSLNLLHRLFDKKRPQIIAMWIMDNPLTPWDQVSIFQPEMMNSALRGSLLYRLRPD
jgi:hypothetical protein